MHQTLLFSSLDEEKHLLLNARAGNPTTSQIPIEVKKMCRPLQKHSLKRSEEPWVVHPCLGSFNWLVCFYKGNVQVP